MKCAILALSAASASAWTREEVNAAHGKLEESNRVWHAAQKKATKTGRGLKFGHMTDDHMTDDHVTDDHMTDDHTDDTPVDPNYFPHLSVTNFYDFAGFTNHTTQPYDTTHCVMPVEAKAMVPFDMCLGPIVMTKGNELFNMWLPDGTLAENIPMNIPADLMMYIKFRGCFVLENGLEVISTAYWSTPECEGDAYWHNYVRNFECEWPLANSFRLQGSMADGVPTYLKAALNGASGFNGMEEHPDGARCASFAKANMNMPAINGYLEEMQRVFTPETVPTYRARLPGH